MTNYKTFFGFTKEPFSQDIRAEELYITPALTAVCDRILYTIHTGAVSLITGEVGAGKSTALRYAVNKLHPSQYRIIPVIAVTGSINEILKQVCLGLGVESKTTSITTITKTIRTIVSEIAAKKQTPVLIIDEANLMRLEVFAQLHTLAQFELDSKPIMPTILAGQNALVDKLKYHASRPLASRVVARSHIEGIKPKDMQGYLKHHQQIAGINEQLFSDEAILAIYQNSGGLIRRTNILARGALIAAATEQSRVVSAEHVRIASTELI